MNKKKPILFLSHADSDTAATSELKARILDTSAAKKVGLKDWFDKDDFFPGDNWQVALEDAIQNKATAFAVYVNNKGVVNWVKREVRLALSRATGQTLVTGFEDYIAQVWSLPQRPNGHAFNVACAWASNILSLYNLAKCYELKDINPICGKKVYALPSIGDWARAEEAR